MQLKVCVVGRSYVFYYASRVLLKTQYWLCDDGTVWSCMLFPHQSLSNNLAYLPLRFQLTSSVRRLGTTFDLSTVDYHTPRDLDIYNELFDHRASPGLKVEVFF
jgi:hypothetical protein